MTGPILYAVLNMGLGHASRSLPLIHELQARGRRVIIASSGRALAFLQRELPSAHFLPAPDYRIRYSRGRGIALALAAQAPRILAAIIAEQRFCRQAVAEYQPDLIISDHCYGMYHSQVPAFLISHQIRFIMPSALTWLARPAAAFNAYFHRRYRQVIIPDFPAEGGGMLSGELSRYPAGNPHYYYGGILSSIERRETGRDVDVLFAVSGPEPQRTLLEEKVLAQVASLPGRKVVVLGKSETLEVLRDDAKLTIFTHLPRRELADMFNRARLVVCRSGYSTLMELAELGTPALLVPTPGQTEQLYLAAVLRAGGYCHVADQSTLDLERDIPLARRFPGLPRCRPSAHSARDIVEQILNQPGSAGRK